MATPLSQPITDPTLQSFVSESVRSGGDNAAGVFAIVPQFLAAVQGKGFSVMLGTDDATLFRAAPWTDADYAATYVGTPQPIVGSDSSNRTLLTNVDVIALIRLFVFIQNSIAANPEISLEIAKIAVNPRV